MSRTGLAVIGLSVVLLSGCAQLNDPAISVEDGLGKSNNPATSYIALVASGDDAIAQNDLDTAQVKYALAVNLQPESVGGLYKLAIVHYRKKSYEVAREILKRVTLIDATHSGALETLGFIALQKERFAQAETHFGLALESEPDRWRSLNGLGIVKDMQSEHGKAQQYFHQAKMLVVDNAAGMARVENNLGYSLYLQGKYKQSLQHFIQATRFAPQYAKAWSNLGLGLARVGRYEEARAAFGKLVDTHVAANNLGFVGMLIGNFAMAKREINTALNTAPTYYALANENLALLKQRAEQSAAEPAELAATATEQEAIVVVPAVSRLRPNPVRRKSLPRNKTIETPILANYLRFLGYGVDARNNESNKQMVNAVRDFQISHDLKADGIAGRATSGLIARATVQRVQLFLESLGYQPGEQDGILSRPTRKAIRAYKTDTALPVDEELNRVFLDRLAGLSG